MKKNWKTVAAAALLASSLSVWAQGQPGTQPQNVVQLSAAGVVEVAQDLLTLSLSTSKEAADAATVQTQLKQALDAALAEAKRQAQPGQMDVRTGPFGIAPRYSKDGKITGWQGRAELVLEGRDFERMTATAGRIQSLQISQVNFGLSREARGKVESQAQAQAVEQFKARALELTRSFGFADYSLREIMVNSNESMPSPRFRPNFAEAKFASAAQDAPVAVEAGRAQVVVNISGSVQLR
jgi:predicted secreted protein